MSHDLRHGFRSQTVLLPGDDPAEYEALLAELTGHFTPHDLSENRFVREMADAEWRLRRVRASLESALTRRMSSLSTDHPDADPIELQSRAIETLGTATGTPYSTWLRYETKFERQYDRAYRDWIHYQNNRRRVSDKEADIWMKKAIFHPVPGEAPATDLKEGQNAAARLTQIHELASSVQNAAESLPSAQAATRAAVVRGSITRSAPCPCGSGQKYKRCCGRSAPPVLQKAA